MEAATVVSGKQSSGKKRAYAVREMASAVNILARAVIGRDIAAAYSPVIASAQQSRSSPENPPMSRPALPLVPRALACLAASIVVASAPLQAQSVTSATVNTSSSTTPRRASLAIESDVLSYGLAGYSGILSASFANGLQVAVGTGRYEVPTFLLEGESHYDAAHWKATATSVQVARATYRLNGPMKNGLALGAVVLRQRWRLSAERLSGTTSFQPVSVGLTAGYYLHLGRHLYLYPTTAFTYNTVASGTPTIAGTTYRVAKWAPNASLHMGWEWAR